MLSNEEIPQFKYTMHIVVTLYVCTYTLGVILHLQLTQLGFLSLENLNQRFFSTLWIPISFHCWKCVEMVSGLLMSQFQK